MEEVIFVIDVKKYWKILCNFPKETSFEVLEPKLT